LLSRKWWTKISNCETMRCCVSRTNLLRSDMLSILLRNFLLQPLVTFHSLRNGTLISAQNGTQKEKCVNPISWQPQLIGCMWRKFEHITPYPINDTMSSCVQTSYSFTFTIKNTTLKPGATRWHSG
jgi:hypothetical protein